MTPGKGKIAVVCVVRNEQRYIAEWIAFHAACGFDAVILYNNLSTDDTVAKALALRPAVDVRVVDWPMCEPDYQDRAYEAAAEAYKDEFAWLAFFDTDEFLVLEPGVDLREVLDLPEETAAVGVSWAMFGSSGHRSRPAGLVIESYLHRSDAHFGPNRHIKSLVRSGRLIKVANPHGFEVSGGYVDLAGRPLPTAPTGLILDAPDYDQGKLHHYFTRSWEDWEAKIARGYNGVIRPLSEFEPYDRNEVLDRSALRLAPAVHALLAPVSERKHAVVTGNARAIVADIFELMLKRTPEETAVEAFGSALTSGALTPLGMVGELMKAEEFGVRALLIPSVSRHLARTLFMALMGRHPGEEAIEAYAAALQNGVDLGELLHDMMNAPEFAARLHEAARS